MKHEVTIISDDCRIEVGNKVSLEGIYDEAIIFRSLPSRLLKLAFYQRWLDFPTPEKVVIAVRGSALDDREIRFDVKPSSRSKQTGSARIIAIIGPIDFMKEGTLEFQIFLNDETKPLHSQQISVRTDPNLKLE